MEKRFVVFLVAAVAIMTGYVGLVSVFAPPPPIQEEVEKQGDPDADDPSGDTLSDKTPPNDKPGDDSPGDDKPGDDTPSDSRSDPQPEVAGSKVTPQWISLGSAAADSGYRLMVTFNNRGAAIERVELTERKRNGGWRFRNLEDRAGHLGFLALTPAANQTPAINPPTTGLRVNVVGAGTPADQATSPSANGGLQPGDVIGKIDGVAMRTVEDFESWRRTTKPGESVDLQVQRADQSLSYTVKLESRPLELIRPEIAAFSAPLQDPLSCLLTLESLDGTKIDLGKREIAGLTSLHSSHWEAEVAADEVVFRLDLTAADLESLGVKGHLQVVKRFRLAKVPADKTDDLSFAGYHLTMDIDVVNKGQATHRLAWRFDGPNGLPLEGWWYSNKVHPGWSAAGARDVMWQVTERSHNLRGCSAIVGDAQDAPESRAATLLASTPDEAGRSLKYVGVDTQYFNATLVPGTLDEPRPFVCQDALAYPIGKLPTTKDDKKLIKTMNTTFRVISPQVALAPGKSTHDSFVLFLGPKDSDLLENYGLSKAIEYGWFPMVAKPLSWILAKFYSLVGNYGLAIIMLTVLVRGCMHPMSRKASQNAQMMQQLAPEMKAIKEKHKDLQKQAEAQRELFAKYNYNPMSGCLLMFVQLPIFIGLYRCLSVDIHLRQAALIPGLQWCSNLAGPDFFWRWDSVMPSFFTGKVGFLALGPYLNVLPIVTIVLFLVQQKMMMPPATDDQTRMQQQMMKYMMIFFGFMFFKVPSGLCIYFVASSIWGLVERKMLPKPKPPNSTAAGAVSKEKKPAGLFSSLMKKAEEKAEETRAEKLRRKRKGR